MKLSLRWFSLSVAFAGLVACAGDATAPSASSSSEANLKINTIRKTATSADISVTSSGGFFVLGKHAIRFPRKSICDPSSSYGITEWDKPCEPAKGPVNFHVELVSANGREWLHFTPEVRFVPTNRVSEYVMLYMRVDGLTRELSEDDLQILWSPAIGVPGIDESIADPTLRTLVSYGTGIVSRRVKHFSTFSVRDGECLPTDLECLPPLP